MWWGDGGNSATPLWPSLIMMEVLLKRQTSKEKLPRNLIVILQWRGWYWPGSLSLPPVPHSCSPGSVGSSPWPGLFPRRPHAHNRQLASPFASTPALLIYLLSLLRPSYKPNNSTFGSVQQASELLNFLYIPTAPGENKHCPGSVFMTGSGFGELYPPHHCAHMQQEKTKGLAQSLSAHGRHFKPSCKRKKNMLCM